jgi:hypothetical protein
MLELLDAQIGDAARKREAEKRIRLAIDTIDRHFREAEMDDMKSEFGSATAELNRAGADSDDGSEQQRKPSREELLEGVTRRRVFSHGAANDLGKLLADKIRKDSREEKATRKVSSKSESAIGQRNGGGGGEYEGRRRKRSKVRGDLPKLNQVHPSEMFGSGEEIHRHHHGDDEEEGGRRGSRLAFGHDVLRKPKFKSQFIAN